MIGWLLSAKFLYFTFWLAVTMPAWVSPFKSDLYLVSHLEMYNLRFALRSLSLTYDWFVLYLNLGIVFWSAVFRNFAILLSPEPLFWAKFLTILILFHKYSIQDEKCTKKKRNMVVQPT